VAATGRPYFLLIAAAMAESAAAATAPACSTSGFTLGEFNGDEAVVGLEHQNGVGRGVLLNVGQHAGHAIRGHGAIDHGQLEKLTSELLGLFVGGGACDARKFAEIERR